MRKTLPRFLAMLSCLLGMQAHAADFLFQVPVKLDRIPSGIAQAKILCEVFSYRDNLNPIASGYSIKAINLRSGALHQEIDVKVNFQNQYRHLKAHQYRCQLLLLTPWAKPSWQTPGKQSAIAVLQPRENSSPVTMVQGLIR